MTGAGGFIGHHLVKRLKVEGCWVRGVDIKPPEYEPSAADQFELLDLRAWDNCLLATRGSIDQVYNLAADMGGIGYITASLADIARNNTLINTHMLEAARSNGVRRFLYSSSACVYAGYKQKEAEIAPLKEEDAYPAGLLNLGFRVLIVAHSAQGQGLLDRSRVAGCRQRGSAHAVGRVPSDLPVHEEIVWPALPIVPPESRTAPP